DAERTADRGSDGREHVGEPLAHERPQRILDGHRHAALGDEFREHRVGEELAVGDHAVEIEHDQLLHASAIPLLISPRRAPATSTIVRRRMGEYICHARETSIYYDP